MEKNKKENDKNGEKKEALQEKAPVKSFKISDKRFWKKRESGEAIEEAKESEYPTFIEELRAKKEESDRKLMEYIQAFKKMQAEQEEFRERLKRDIDKKIIAGKRDLFIKLLDMIDNLERAISSARNSGEKGGLLDGVIISRDMFLGILKREGVEKLEVLGKPFDPQFAEAVMVQEVSDPAKENMVLEEIQPGYTFGGQILRPVKVKVAKLIVRNEVSSEEQK